MDLGDLPRLWGLVAKELARVEVLSSPAQTRQLSARAFDEAQVAGPRTYMAVTRYLGVVRDNHDALLALLEHRGATLWAPWSLLRPTFECSFLAAWILDPEEGRERRARGLRCEIIDFYEQRKHREALKRLPEVRKLLEKSEQASENSSLSVYRDEVAQLGRMFDALRQKVNVTGELARLSFVRSEPKTGAFLEAAWRQLSGFEHGFGWALLSGTDRRIEAELPGGYGARFVINDDAFVNAASATAFLVLSACRVLVRRHFNPSNAGAT